MVPVSMRWLPSILIDWMVPGAATGVTGPPAAGAGTEGPPGLATGAAAGIGGSSGGRDSGSPAAAPGRSARWAGSARRLDRICSATDINVRANSAARMQSKRRAPLL